MRLRIFGIISWFIIYSFLIFFLIFYIVYTPKIVISNEIPITKNNEPTYEYLTSVSVYLFHSIPTDETDNTKEHGAIGSGTIIADKDGWFYILTNYHVCEEDEGNCYIVLDGNNDISNKYILTFIKAGSMTDDLAVWKIQKCLLPDKNPIIGFNSVKVQDKVYSVGQYLGLPYVYTEGTMAQDGILNDLFNMPCTHGCSGSGVFNNKGELVSVVFAGHILPVEFLTTPSPLLTYMDTSKILGIKMIEIKDFLKGIIDENKFDTNE